MTPDNTRPTSEPAARESLSYPARIAILGGGQLARMTAEAAARLGIEVAILEREANSPAGGIAARELGGAGDDRDAPAPLPGGALAVTPQNGFVEGPALGW